ncbi:VOC family protein [uncultured Arthrobacter sp.]|uniref:VOC family protein n=1 Tax=uncultured Arthrobacter sp. TaxID=114050 RepID=UPI0025F58E67|nr:VOC family protein [uncultured Arthrobacter sp.]
MTAAVPSRLEAGIIVNELDRMIAFYCQALGLRPVDDRSFASGTRIVELGAGSSRVKLNRPEPPPTVPPHAGRHREALGLRYLTVVVADATAVHERLDEDRWAGLEPLRESPSGLLFFVPDPEGNWVEVVQPVA